MCSSWHGTHAVYRSPPHTRIQIDRHSHDATQTASTHHRASRYSSRTPEMVESARHNAERISRARVAHMHASKAMADVSTTTFLSACLLFTVNTLTEWQSVQVCMHPVDVCRSPFQGILVRRRACPAHLFDSACRSVSRAIVRSQPRKYTQSCSAERARVTSVHGWSATVPRC